MAKELTELERTLMTEKAEEFMDMLEEFGIPGVIVFTPALDSEEAEMQILSSVQDEGPGYLLAAAECLIHMSSELEGNVEEDEEDEE